MKNDPLKTIGFIAERAATSVSAIRFYADKGLLPSVRAPSGHRLFHRSTIRRVSFILICQQLGYSLDEIASVLARLPSSRTPDRTDWTNLAHNFTKDIDARIAKLQQLKLKLDGCIGCGCLSLDKCDLYNPEDKVALKGKGAQLFNF